MLEQVREARLSRTLTGGANVVGHRDGDQRVRAVDVKHHVETVLERVLLVVDYGSFATESGRRQRYRCTVCRGTVSTNTGTAYSGLRCTRRECDQVASLRVEGVSLSATARVTGHSRNTVARWFERASTAATRFNDRMLHDLDPIELQADELCTFVGDKNKTVWLFATIEGSSRLWAGSVLGRRSDRNARDVINDVVRRGRVVGTPLITTDGSEYYVGAVGASLDHVASMVRCSRLGGITVSSGSSAA